jgi:hypothetical protein
MNGTVLDLFAFQTADEFEEKAAAYICDADTTFCLHVPYRNAESGHDLRGGCFIHQPATALRFRDIFQLIAGQGLQDEVTFAATNAALISGAWRVTLREDRVSYDAGDIFFSYLVFSSHSLGYARPRHKEYNTHKSMDPSIAEIFRRWDEWNAQNGVCTVRSLETFFTSLMMLSCTWRDEGPQQHFVLQRLREQMELFENPEALFGFIVSRTCYAQALREAGRDSDALLTVEAALSAVHRNNRASFSHARCAA